MTDDLDVRPYAKLSLGLVREARTCALRSDFSRAASALGRLRPRLDTLVSALGGAEDEQLGHAVAAMTAGWPRLFSERYAAISIVGMDRAIRALEGLAENPALPELRDVVTALKGIVEVGQSVGAARDPVAD